jgi:hypothetical protein
VLDESAPRFGKYARHAVHEPVDLRSRREEHAAQHETEHAIRMRLRVQEREGRPPRAAEQQPLVDSEMLAQPLDVVDQMRGRVVTKLGDRRRAAGAALIVEHDAPERRIVEPAVVRQAAAAGTAVDEQQRHAGGVAAFLPVHRVQAVERQHARQARRDFGVERRFWSVAGREIVHQAKRFVTPYHRTS